MLPWKEVNSMHVKITYPSVEKSKFGRQKLLRILRWPFWGVAIASTITNLCIGRPYWFIVVLMSLYIVWKLVFAIDLVEYNRMSQSIKVVLYSCLLLTLIDITLADVHAMLVVPIVCFSGITVCSVLFLTDFETQKHNMFPLILLMFFAILASAICLIFWPEYDNWPFIVLAAISAVMLIAFIVILGSDFRREMQRRLHIK